MEKNQAFRPYMEWRDEKENKGKFTWTLGLYGTKAGADEAGLSEKEYWNEIIKACYLNDRNPVKTWQKITKETERVKNRLDALKIEKVRVLAKNTDLTVVLVGIFRALRFLFLRIADIPMAIFILMNRYTGTVI
jgi:aminopeptidase